MAELTRFKYTALPTKDTLRILEIEPGIGTEPLRCSLNDVSFKESICQYEAISYVWGRADNTTDITVNGRQFAITVNLARTLKRFRLPDKPRGVWADSLCINQGDNKEKSHQVQRMGTIYQNAKRVLCWLGDDDQGIADKCFDAVRKANKLIEERWKDGWGFENLSNDLKLPELVSGDIDWRHFKRLLELPWFGRLWVVQEAGLARECWLVWGNAETEIWQIPALAAWFAYSVDAPRLTDGMSVGHIWREVFADIMCTYRNKPTWRDQVPLRGPGFGIDPRELYVDLLFCAKSLATTDQRDIIYSSLGSPLAYYNDGTVMVPPDYSEPFNLLQVRAAKALLRNPREAPHLLLRVVHEKKDELDDDIPSWVPRWNTSQDAIARPMPLTLTFEYRQNPYQASHGMGAFNIPPPQGDSLPIKALIFDSIAWTSPVLSSGDLGSDVNKWKSRYRDDRMSIIETMWQELHNKSADSSENLLSAFSLTLARGRPGSEHYLNDFLAYCEVLQANAGSPGLNSFPLPGPNKSNASDAERCVVRSRARRLAYTSNGRIALVPVVAEVADVCCIIPGVDVPVILRQVRNKIYKFTGDAYVHGVMEGELQGFKSSSLVEIELK